MPIVVDVNDARKGRQAIDVKGFTQKSGAETAISRPNTWAPHQMSRRKP